jgi:hypothetical protein
VTRPSEYSAVRTVLAIFPVLLPSSSQTWVVSQFGKFLNPSEDSGTHDFLQSCRLGCKDSSSLTKIPVPTKT